MGSASVSPEPRPVDFYVRFVTLRTEAEEDIQLVVMTF